MQMDFEALEVDCEKRLEKLRGEKYESEQSYREEIERLKKNEKKLMEEIHSRQSHNVELLEKEHAETIEAISRAKELERKAVNSITTNRTDLGDLLNRSQLVIDSFQNLQKKIEDKDEAFGETRGGYLRKQEEILQREHTFPGSKAGQTGQLFYLQFWQIFFSQYFSFNRFSQSFRSSQGPVESAAGCTDR